MLRPIKGQQRALGGPSRAAPRLISRVWLYGPTDGGTTPSRSVNTTVPAGARWVDARAIGSGGGFYENTAGGGGAAYARARAPVAPGETIVSVIAGQTVADTDGVASTVTLNSRTFVKAAGGKTSLSSFVPGAGAAAADCIGETIVAGSVATALANGGASGSDAAASDSLNLGGYERKDRTRTTDGTEAPLLSDYGAGGSGVLRYPANPSGGGWSGDSMVGGAGIVVLEFWSKKPT